MASMLLERLRGIDFNGARYIVQRNTPDPSAKSYHYVPYGRSEARPRSYHPPVVKPNFMAPPVLRMPTFTAPPPFKPGQSAPPPSREPLPEKKEEPVLRRKPEKKKGIFSKLKDLF